MDPPPAPLDNAAAGKTKVHGKITQWFIQNPLASHAVSFLLGVLSFGATMYFGVQGVRTRELSLYVNPSKTTIVKSGQSSDLHIQYKGKDVSTDVTALQVELWNAGKESIRPEQILLPIILETTPKVPILEARIRHISRPLTQVVLDQSHIADGTVAVSWKILEHDDGAVIQFIIAGPAETSITASGAMEEQHTVEVLHALGLEHWWVYALVNIFMMICSLGFGMIYTRWLIKRNKVPETTPQTLLRLIGPLLLVSVILGMVVNYFLRAPSVPIPFD
jgi:hypothetical protein